MFSVSRYTDVQLIFLIILEARGAHAHVLPQTCCELYLPFLSLTSTIRFETSITRHDPRLCRQLEADCRSL